MSTHNVLALQCYHELANQGTIWMRCTWGDSSVIGFRGEAADIKLAYRLFATYDPRPKRQLNSFIPAQVFPAPPSLHWLWEHLAYCYMPESRLLDTLTLYFKVMIARELGHLNEPLITLSAPPILEPDLELGESDVEYVTRALQHWADRAAEIEATEADSIDDQLWVVDDQLVDSLATQAARSFMEHHIKVSCFMPNPQTVLSEHSMGSGDKAESSRVEDLASLV